MRRRDLLSLLCAFVAAPAAAAERPTASESFIALPSLNANVPRGGVARRGIMTVDVGLDVPDAALRTRVQSLVPRIRADLYSDMQTFAAGQRPGGLPDAEMLTRRLQAIVNRIVGRAGARVLIGAIVVT